MAQPFRRVAHDRGSHRSGHPDEDKIQAGYAAAHPAPASDPGDPAGNRKPRKNERPLRQRALEEWEAYCKRQRLRDTENGKSALNWL